jgi:hypothetical protein
MSGASLLRLGVGAALVGLGLFCLLAFHERYWLRRDCFNELGRCFDPASGLVYTEAAAIWGVLGGLCLALGAALLALVLTRR